MITHSGASTVLSAEPDGAYPQPLGVLGHVAALQYSDAMPGGPDTLSATLQASPALRTPLLDPGRRITVQRGASIVWEGALDEPAPGDEGWAITAHGAGTWAAQYLSMWATWNADNPVDQAISRGLDWANPGIDDTGRYLSERQDPATQTLEDFLGLITSGGHGTWHLGPFRRLTVGDVPSAVTRIMVCAYPASRTLAGYVNALCARYRSGGTDASPVYATTWAVNSASITAHGRTEAAWDITEAGTMTATAAGDLAAKALARYRAVTFGGPFTLAPGQYLTAGGVPVDLGCEKAGEAARLVMMDGPYGGEVTPGTPVTFPVGKTEYDDDTGALTVTPFDSIRSDLQSLLASLIPPAKTGKAK